MNSDVETLLRQARANHASGNYKVTLQLLRRALDLSRNDPETQGQIYFDTARVYAGGNKDSNVISLIKKSLDCNPGLYNQVRDWAAELNESGKKRLAKAILDVLKRDYSFRIDLASSDTESEADGVSADKGGFENVLRYTKSLFSIQFKPGVFLKYAALSCGLVVVFLVIWLGFSFIISHRFNKDTKLDIARIKDNVGQIFIVVTVLDRDNLGQVTIPLRSGSSFAVSGDGFLITNKHVIDLYHDVQKWMDIIDCDLIICYGDKPKDRYTAKIIHECPYFDAALLKISKNFRRPFNKLAKDISIGDKVLACGFPGTATDLVIALDSQKLLEQYGKEIKRLRNEGTADFFELVPKASFEVSVTAGIISSTRNINDIQWLQTDASVHSGNSGGPLLTQDLKLAAVNTLKHTDSESTNLSLLASQLKLELAPWVKLK